MTGRPKKDKKYVAITFTAPLQFKEDLDTLVEEGDKSRFLREEAKKGFRRIKAEIKKDNS